MRPAISVTEGPLCINLTSGAAFGCPGDNGSGAGLQGSDRADVVVKRVGVRSTLIQIAA
jgi:hypothetical protein